MATRLTNNGIHQWLPLQWPKVIPPTGITPHFSSASSTATTPFPLISSFALLPLLPARLPKVGVLVRCCLGVALIGRCS